MSVRRWIGISGIVLAVAAGAVGTGRAGSGSAFEARAFLRLELPHSTRALPEALLDERERFLGSPEVTELVRSRLGDTPPAWATATAADTVVVRSRGATPEQAAKATETYAASYADVRRGRIEAEVSTAAEAIRRKTDQIKAQLESAEEPQRTSLVGLLGVFNTQLDRLDGDHRMPSVVGSSPAEPIHDWSWSALSVAGLGAAVGAGAVVSARSRAGVAGR